MPPPPLQLFGKHQMVPPNIITFYWVILLVAPPKKSLRKSPVFVGFLSPQKSK
uniref:Uncharacterized protein n=1 Tax=Anguilla anguilla TaxID=7936 RepID=A0A0E9TH54_ANGAN